MSASMVIHWPLMTSSPGNKLMARRDLDRTGVRWVELVGTAGFHLALRTTGYVVVA
jgi:hypothetical protein